MVEHQARTISELTEFVDACDEAMVRLTFILASSLPATDAPLASLLREWNRVKSEIRKDYSHEA